MFPEYDKEYYDGKRGGQPLIIGPMRHRMCRERVSVYRFIGRTIQQALPKG